MIQWVLLSSVYYFFFFFFSVLSVSIFIVSFALNQLFNNWADDFLETVTLAYFVEAKKKREIRFKKKNR